MSDAQTFSHFPSWPLPVRRQVTITPRHSCSYFPDRLSVFRAFEAEHVPPEEFQRLLDAGFRRSGSIIYQPMCGKCRDCVPIRVPTETFTPSKSQRRVRRKNADVVVSVSSPAPTAEKWELYERYQRQWHRKNNAETEDFAGFISFLYHSPVESLEFEYRDPWGKLLGVGICDLCPASLSSVYFYFDPDQAHRSPGTFSAMYEIDWARQAKLSHWYAGYWIKNCPSMAYKSRFQPCEVLRTDGRWRRLEEESTSVSPA